MITLRRMKAMVLGQDLNGDSDYVRDVLEASCIPVTEVDCRTCPDPCDEGHEGYPTRFDVDRESQMLGSVKPYCRQVVISTGQSDWDRDITDAKGSLAAHLHHVSTNHRHQKAGAFMSGSPPPAAAPASPPLPAISSSDVPSSPKLRPRHVAGVFTSSDSAKISILNGSHKSLCDDERRETVLVFPDYKMVSQVCASLDGAQDFFDMCVDPQLGRGVSYVEKSPFNTWIIPYSCVILLCSHKKRDNRCSIAAGKLEHAFSRTLESRGWQVDTQLEYPIDLPLEDFQGTESEQEEHILSQLQDLQKEKKALIIKNSHTGGHRYAGNCIIYTPQGSGVWYGRVSAHEVESIVSQTLEEGRILAPLLRGGMNIARPGCKSLHDW